MGDRITTGPIRRIIVGDIKDGMSFRVGQPFRAGDKKIEITEIVRDENNFFLFGSIRYLIYAKDEEGTHKIWKYIENQPVTVEPDFS